LRVETIIDPVATPISGDPERLQQVMWNLLSNAVKFTGRGGKVQVRLERVNSHVEVAVSDTGIGISPEFLPHVFERFRQADASISRERGGLGLGLSIAKQLTEMHGGTIEASSGGVNQGATFRVKIPVMIVHPLSKDVTRVHPRAASTLWKAALPNLEHIRVLAVDDEADALALVSDVLQAAGARVSTASSADDALRNPGDRTARRGGGRSGNAARGRVPVHCPRPEPPRGARACRSRRGADGLCPVRGPYESAVGRVPDPPGEAHRPRGAGDDGGLPGQAVQYASGG
jgi:anti-sigma regulatory factor (Ser/Thr protein kinase)